MSDIPLKQCTGCNNLYPATAEFFHRNAKRKDGLSWTCKLCARRIFLKRQTNIDAFNTLKEEKQRRHEAGDKYCPHCRQFYPANSEYFGICLRSKDGLLYICKKCNRRKQKLYREQIPDEKREQDNERKRRWHQDPGNHRRMAFRNKQRAPLTKARRRALKLSLPNTFSAQDWQRCLDYWNHSCAACGRPAGLWHTLAADHWIPLDRGGPTTPENMIPLCHPRSNVSGGVGCCNATKKNFMPDVWLKRHFGDKKAAEIIARVQAYFDWLKDN